MTPMTQEDTDSETTPDLPANPFEGIPEAITDALVKRGFTELTPVQRAVLDAELAGKDLRISSQTGSGKTVAIGLALAYELLAAQKAPEPEANGKTTPDSKRPASAPRGHAARPVALVIVPTRELAAQVQTELGWLYANLRDLRVEVVTGGTSIMTERRALARGPALVVGTPGRLLDHMRNNALACDRISHVVLDEADQMLDMGFREELEAILEQLPEKRSSHLVSATFPHAVTSLANRYQRDVLRVEGTRLGVANADIHHIAYPIRRHETYPALVNTLLLAEDSRCLLFVNRRVDATELAEKLAADGFGAAPFSGELPQAQRTRTLNAFKSGTFKILVSTDVAARGIDVPEISTVIHVDPPRNPDAYVHRSGRTGRAGLTGKSILLVAGPESRKVTRMLRDARIEVSWQPVPQAEKVQKALMKQARRQLHERLTDETTLTEAQLVYANQLLEEKDPARLVATLLEMATPEPPHAPMKVQGLDPFQENSGARGRSDDRGGSRGRDARGPSTEPTGYTKFSVTWGEQSGATASRLLSHVCRRGGLNSQQVGAIRIDAKSSTVDVANEVASLFESKAKRPDKRDPGIMIRLAEGARAPSPVGHRPSGTKSGSHGAAHHSGHSGPGSYSSASDGRKHSHGGPPSGPASGPASKFKGRGPKAPRPGRPGHAKGKGPRRNVSR
jgi:ATP-dependent RNA helicase DeaD